MALIEATDDYFTQVRDRLALAQAPGQRVAASLSDAYRDFTGLEPDHSPLNTLLIDHFRAWAREDFDEQLQRFVREKPFIADFIRERAASSLLYRQPGILLAYWAIKQAPRAAGLDGPLSEAELAPLYGDLGERQPGVG